MVCYKSNFTTLISENCFVNHLNICSVSFIATYPGLENSGIFDLRFIHSEGCKIKVSSGKVGPVTLL